MAHHAGVGVVVTDSGRIGVIERGGGSATPLVLLHGVGSDKSVWAPQLAAFGEQRRTIALDYPGYGESDLLPEATLDDFASAILAALDSLGVGRAHVCGLSLGGVVAIAINAIAPQRCASLILADSFAVHPDGRGIHDRSVEASRRLGMRALAEARVDALLGSHTTTAIRDEVVETMSRIDPAAYALGARAVWLADQVKRACTIRVPTLVLVGDEDRITPPTLSDELAALIADARLATIAGAGHLANLEQPDAFNQAVESFLTEIE